jgi:hypothetical protein
MLTRVSIIIIIIIIINYIFSFTKQSKSIRYI